MVARVLSEVRLDAAVCREGFIFEFLIVYEFGLVNEQPREGERVGGAGAVLRDDHGARAVVE